jgi:protein-disulfide isomerase
MKAPEIEAMVESDLREGKNAGVRGIPTIFINGRLLRERSFAGFQAAIEKELAQEDKKKK